ncbi:hypothetical protein GCM10023231_23690 [Olivibacter ginsenosidimutans]|uniref:DUF6965 domain-containing protein n=1 Tax=Olivibacter ginsenosidimutans TaxID=1176537 RepID=A0ABP9BET2_9SPHI
MTPEEIKNYFDSNPPPFEIEWKPWAKIANTKKFLEACYTAIEHYKGSYQNCPDYWHLLEFYKDRVSDQNASETPAA